MMWMLMAQLERRTANGCDTSATCTYISCNNEAEAKGHFFSSIESEKPGFYIRELNCIPVKREDMLVSMVNDDIKRVPAIGEWWVLAEPVNGKREIALLTISGWQTLPVASTTHFQNYVPVRYMDM